PISTAPGEFIPVSVPDEEEDESSWRQAAKKHFLNAYGDEDAIYDGR
ncbi:MAG: hypothetical protein GWN62_35930, partial [Aliifodinibius sp.]|nr:hypothetical protein [Fodinibius sp.]